MILGQKVLKMKT